MIKHCLLFFCLLLMNCATTLHDSSSLVEETNFYEETETEEEMCRDELTFPHELFDIKRVTRNDDVRSYLVNLKSDSESLHVVIHDNVAASEQFAKKHKHIVANVDSVVTTSNIAGAECLSFSFVDMQHTIMCYRDYSTSEHIVSVEVVMNNVADYDELVSEDMQHDMISHYIQKFLENTRVVRTCE